MDPAKISTTNSIMDLPTVNPHTPCFIFRPGAETLGDPYIRGLPLPMIPLSRELQPDAGQTVSVKPISERTPRARLTRLLNGHTKIMQGLE